MSEVSTSDESMILGSERRGSGAKKRRRLMLVLVLLILFIGGALAWYAVGYYKTEPEPVCTGALPEDYETADKNQVHCLYKQETGKSFGELNKKPIVAENFKSFDDALEAALALKAYGRFDESSFKKSLTAYGIADGLAKGESDADWNFYLDYSQVALLAKDEKLYAKAQEKYKQAIQNDKSITPELKKEMLDRAAQAERLRKLGY